MEKKKINIIRLIITIGLLFLLLAITTTAWANYSSSKKEYLVNISTASWIGQINQYRQENNRGPVRFNQLLSNSARAKACDMQTRGYWSHDTPEGKHWWEFITAVGYKYTGSGENLARRMADDKIVQAWIYSPKHREILLDKRWKDVGVERCGDIVALHMGVR